jgi:murein tripeptide amidase MpaA
MKRLFLLVLFISLLKFSMAQNADWQTYYEASGFTKTPRYEETMNFCRRMADASGMITMKSFGTSAQGRDMMLMIIDRDHLSEPSAIHSAGRAVMLVQACIHPGESEGKDAMLMLVRDLVINKKYPGILDQVSILFIPIFNVDGHERFGPYNRINQNGPEEMGWRVTANNLNLNRDFLKADTPEMQAWLKMFSRWMPDFFIDTHTTDGADYQYALTYLMEVSGDMDKALTDWSEKTFIPEMTASMESAGFPVFPYVEFRNWHDPRSGLITEVAPPMLSQAYTALRNRPGLLIETHMLKNYKIRVDATYQCILSSMNIISKQSKTLVKLVADADKYVSSPAFREQLFPLQYQTFTNDSTMVDFRGFSYTLEKSPISGGSWFNYSNTPEVMQVPWFKNSHAVFSVKLPIAYIIPVEWSTVISRLEAHGIKIRYLEKETRIPVSGYRFKNPKWQASPYEGRHPMTNIEYDEYTEERVFPAGSAIVEMNQPAGRIIPQILEPKGDGSFVYWGFFDAVFEQKEYGENYVVEKLAADMLQNNPSLKHEFEQKKAADSLFARNPQQILNWFYLKSPYGDTKRLVYPVGRIMDQATLERILKD